MKTPCPPPAKARNHRMVRGDRNPRHIVDGKGHYQVCLKVGFDPDLRRISYELRATSENRTLGAV